MTRFTEEQMDALLELIDAKIALVAYRTGPYDMYGPLSESTRASEAETLLRAVLQEEPEPEPTPSHIGKWEAKPHTGCGSSVAYGVYNPVTHTWKCDDKRKGPWRGVYASAVREAKRLNELEI